MKQTFEIRADIIDPLLYCKIKLYYENIIEVIDSLYGYMLHQHFCEIFTDKSKMRATRLIKKMESDGVIKSLRLKNCKYLRLEGVAIKYLRKIKKNITFLPDDPGNKILYRSFYAAKYYINYGILPITVKKYLDSQGASHSITQNNLYYRDKTEFVNFVMFDYDQSKSTYQDVFISLYPKFDTPFTLTIFTKSKNRQHQLKNQIENILSNNDQILNSDKEGRVFGYKMKIGLQQVVVIDSEIEKYFKLNTSLGESIRKKREVDRILEIADKFYESTSV